MNKEKSSLRLILYLSLLVPCLIFYQNCSQINNDSISEPTPSHNSIEIRHEANGHGYDGKLYTNFDLSRTCEDGTNYIHQIILLSPNEAFLVKDNCKVIKPLSVPVGELQIDDSKLVYQGIEFKEDKCGTNSNLRLGTQCVEGTIYAGRFDYRGDTGILNLMITPGNCESSSDPICDGQLDQLQLEWGNSGVRTGLTDFNEGELNTIELVETFGPSPAAQYCYDLNFAGFDDWYLPAADELAFLLNAARQDLLPGFQMSPSLYWSSTDASEYRAQARAPASKPESNKTEQHFVRCVRRY